ncbi:MAG: amidohydrolase [Treponema sp.]|nr:amidohydrolase [Treponema sp.]
MTCTEIFEHLHQNPELSLEEFETTAFIKKILTEEGIEILDLPLKTGLVACIKGTKPGKKIAFRADIDALPLEEKTNLPYKSKNPGKMHACGHDIHISVGLETARLLNQKKSELSGQVLFVFQPSEENGKGALEILKTGVLDGIDAIFSLHSSPLLEVGQVGIKEGAITAAVDLFKIIIKGKGSHGAEPQKGRDPIAASAAVISSLQTIVSRNVNPNDQALVSVTHIQGGSNWNIIPEEVLLEGTIRTTNPEIRAFVSRRLTEIARNTAAAFEEEASVEIENAPPCTNNDKELADFAWKTAESLGLKPVRPEITMVGEDFAFYQEKFRGIMVWLGVGKTKPLHNPEFTANPKSIELGAKYFSEMLISY